MTALTAGHAPALPSPRGATPRGALDGETTISSAHAAADSMVLLADPDAMAANPFYWFRARPAWEAVSEALAQAPDPRVVQAAQAVRLDPAGLDRHENLCAAVRAHLASDHRESVEAIHQALARVHAEARLGYRRGTGRTRLAGRPRLPAPHLAAPHLAVPRQAMPDGPVVNVVIPFRDDQPGHGRLENLTACLATLADQTISRRQYAVTVVETDVVPRWGERIAPLADEYLFARHGGPFNKSWTVNIGAVRTRFPAPLICVLDADAFVDREFIARNIARFDAPGVGSFTPFRSLLYLDAESSAWAIESRCVQGAAAVNPRDTRGFLVYRSPGVCVWMRRTVFEGIHGLDERYEGWGGEDMDVLLRLMARSAFHQFGDLQLHLHHQVQGGILDDDGNSPNVHLPFLTWEPAGPIGEPGKYAPV